MAFLSSIDETLPAEGSSTVAELNDRQREMRAATKNTVGAEHELASGKHQIARGTHAARPAVLAGHLYLSTDNGVLSIGKDGVNWSAVGLPYGTVALFAQSAAPLGWTKVTGFDDRVLRVEDAGGGTTGGAWAITGLTGPSHDHTFTPSVASGGAHTHTYVHTHDVDVSWISGAGITINHLALAGASKSQAGWAFANTPTTIGASSGNVSRTVAQSASTTSSDGAHTHTGNAGTTGLSGTGAVASDGTWRPAYLDVIVCSKDTTF